MKPLVILNPNSQGGRTGKHAEDIALVVERYLGPIELVQTNAPRHATELARSATIDGRKKLVVVGGDGTMHEVVNGVMAAGGDPEQRPTIGLVGQGTGGDFRKTLGIEHHLEKYCLALASRRHRSVDVMRMTYRDRAGDATSGYCVNILSAGMGGLVDEYVAASDKRFGGTAAYLSASARALLNNEVGRLMVTLDPNTSEEKKLELSTRLIAICNGRFFGGGMEMAPMAKPDDGWLDIISLGSAPKPQFAISMLAIYRGTHIDNPDVAVHRARRLVVELANDEVRDRFPLDVDGEPLGTLPLEVEVMPAAVSVCIP